MKKDNNEDIPVNSEGFEEKHSTEGNDAQDNETMVNSDATEERVKAEETKVVNEIEELKDKYIRLYSEFDNYRKRTNKEKIDIIENANESLLKDLLPIIDDFERAIDNNSKTEDIEALKQGFELISSKLINVLTAKGLKAMESKGNKFDSELHDAIANIPAPTPEMVGFVVDDVQKGYYLKEKVIRHAKVVVGQ